MGLFSRKEIGPAGERLPAFIPATCIGAKCPNFSGSDCDNPEMEWMSAGGGKSKAELNTSQPPPRSEATYIIYGQRCLAGAAPTLVAQHVQICKPDKVDTMEIIALTEAYGEMPVRIESGDLVTHIETIASAESM